MIQFPLAVVIGAVDKWTAPLAKMQAKVNGTLAPVNALFAKTQDVAAAAGVFRLAKAFGGVSSAVGDVVRQVGKIGAGVTGAVAAVGGAVYGLVATTATAANDAAKNAQKIGIGVGAYQELAFAAELADVEQASFNKGLQIFSRTIGQAALGSKQANDGFRRLGINVRDSHGQIRPVTELLGETADKLNHLDDPLKRNAIASKIFGRGAAELTPLLAGGSKAFAAYAAEARALGVVMSEEDVAASEEFKDSQDRMKASMLGVRNVIGTALMPVVNDLMLRVRDFFVGHKGEIAAYATNFAKGLPDRLAALGEGLKSLWAVVKPGIQFVGFLFDTFGAGPVIITTLATVIGAVLIPPLITLTTSVYALGAALFTTPIGWIVLGIAAVVAGVVLLWKNWDKVWGGIVSSGQRIGAFFVRLGGHVWRPVRAAIDKITGYWTTFRDFMVSLWDGIVSKFNAAWDWIAGKLGQLGGLVPDWLRGVFGGAPAAPAPSGFAPTASVDNARAQAALAVKSQSTVEVRFENAPRGLRVTEAQGGGVDLDLSLGYTLAGGG